jgi:hypothetical protein
MPDCKECNTPFEATHYARKFCSNTCKSKSNSRDWRANNPKKSVAFTQQFRLEHPQLPRDISNRYYAKNSEKVKKRTGEYKKFHKDRHYAHFLIGAMLYFGLMVRPTRCSNCGKECKPQAHHHRGYSGQCVLDIVWLCVRCHSAADKAMKDLLLAESPAS